MVEPLSLLRDNIERMSGYVPGEQPQDGGYIKLNTNENPYPPSPSVIAALKAALNADLRLYPDPVAEPVRRKAAEVFGTRPECVLVGNGSDDLLTIIMRSFADAGDTIAFPVPTYSLYETLAQIQDARAAQVPYESDYSLPAGLGEASARITFVANPNSPSGTCIPTEELERLAVAVAGVLVIDEAYVDFADSDSMGLAKTLPNVVVLRTLSKSFALCGLRIGLAVAHERLIEGMMKVKDSYNVNRLGAIAAAAALDDVEYMCAIAAKIRATRARLSAQLEEMGFSVYPSQANFVLARKSGDPSARDLYLSLKERKMLVRYFDRPRLDDCLRITVGTDDEIDQLIANLRACLE